MLLNVIVDCVDDLWNVLEHASAQTFVSEVAKKAFHHIEPGGAGWCEVYVKTWMPGQPAFNLWMLVSGVVIDDQMQVFLRRGLAVNELQKLQPFLMPMTLHV